MSATFEQMRQAMVESQLRTNGVNTPEIVAALASVPRERFVPSARAALAYVDEDVPVGGGRYLMEPMVFGRLLEALQVAPGERVLVVGGTTGYPAAVLAKLGAAVTMVEAGDFADAARGTLADFGVLGVTVVAGDLASGAAAQGPFDALLLDGAVEVVPDALVAQLRDGGRIAGVFVDDGIARARLGVVAGGVAGYTAFLDARVAPLPGFARAKQFQF
jgi:protein-L-isoaspartate(D-aspartate) O-methyltransferase